MIQLTTLSLLIIILLLLLIIFIVYFIIYKKRINKSLEQNESMAHVPMASAESIGNILVKIGIVIYAISIIMNISSVASDVQQTRDELKAEIAKLNGEIRELESQFEQQNAILNSFEYSLGEINSVDNTVETTIRCVPKTVSEDTVVKVIFGDETITLEAEEGGIFTATKPLPLFVDIGYEITVAVTTEGVMNTQIIDRPYEPLYSECLPWLTYVINPELEFENGKVRISGECGIGGWEEMTDIQLFFVMDGAVVKTVELPEQGMELNEVYEMDANSYFELVAEGMDPYGYKHRSILFAAGEFPEYDSDYIITDKSGNVVFR